MDIFEQNDRIRLVVELPGVKPEEVKIAAEGNILTITGTKEQVAEEKAEKINRYERIYGAFERTFTLPEGRGDEAPPDQGRRHAPEDAEVAALAGVTISPWHHAPRGD